MSSRLLPNEIFLEVFALLDDSKDLACISRTCRTFHELVEVLLYSKFSESNSKDLLLLLRTIIEHPKFGRHIKVLELCEPDLQERKSLKREWMQNRRLEHPALRSRLQEYFTLCLPLLDSREYSHRASYVDFKVNDHIGRLYDTYDWDLLATTFLLYTPSLEAIALSWNNKYNKFNILKFLDMATRFQRAQAKDFKDVSPFSQSGMIQVRISTPNPVASSQPFGMRELIPIIRMDSLRSFTCEKISTIDYFDRLEEPILIQNFTFTECGLPTHDLYRLVRTCTNLRHFHLEYSDNNAQVNLGPSNLLSALLNSAETLVTLAILHKDDRPDPSRGNPYNAILPCLKSFTKLQSLDIRSLLVISRRVMKTAADNQLGTVKNLSSSKSFALSDLPDSLEHLALRNAPLNIETMHQFKGHIFSSLPNLKKVRVFFDNEATQSALHESIVDWNAIWADIKKTYAEKGISVSLIFCDD